MAIADLPKLMPAYDWQRYAQGSEIAGKVDSVIVSQPSYFTKLDQLAASTPLPVWKAYFKWHVLTAAAPYLSKPFVDERFAFVGLASVQTEVLTSNLQFFWPRLTPGGYIVVQNFHLCYTVVRQFLRCHPATMVPIAEANRAVIIGKPAFEPPPVYIHRSDDPWADLPKATVEWPEIHGGF